MCWARLEQAASRLRGQQLPTQSPAAGAPSGPRHEGARPSILVTQGQCAARGLARSSERSGSCGVPRAGAGGSRPGPARLCPGLRRGRCQTPEPPSSSSIRCEAPAWLPASDEAAQERGFGVCAGRAEEGQALAKVGGRDPAAGVCLLGNKSHTAPSRPPSRPGLADDAGIQNTAASHCPLSLEVPTGVRARLPCGSAAGCGGGAGNSVRVQRGSR